MSDEKHLRAEVERLTRLLSDARAAHLHAAGEREIASEAARKYRNERDEARAKAARRVLSEWYIVAWHDVVSGEFGRADWSDTYKTAAEARFALAQRRATTNLAGTYVVARNVWEACDE